MPLNVAKVQFTGAAMNEKSLFVQANSLLRSRRYEEAIALYEEVRRKGQHPHGIIDFNLDLARRRLTSSGISRPPPLPRKQHARGVTKLNAFSFAEESCAAYLKSTPPSSLAKEPKVSVVLTCFNAADTIEESVESILNQSYKNLEVIVCDDASTDRSWQVLCAMQQRCSSVAVIRNNANYGTYLSKNRAIDRATGEIILFQDSDDISHPQRVAIQVTELLADSALIATRTKYLRYNESNEQIVPVANLHSKYGLITLAVWKKAFLEIGYFDAVRRAGDDEWFQRLAHLYGDRAVKNVDVTLYLARLRSGSLVADMLTFAADGSSVEQSSSPPRRAYVQQFRSRFEGQRNKEYFRNSFPPFPLRAQAVYPDSVEVLAPVHEQVHAAICSIPSRLDTLRSTIRSLQHQVDGIFVYLDKYDEVPADLRKNPKLTILRSQDFNTDHRDNAKFIGYGSLAARNAPFFYFTCDDDIEYPHDYIATMIRGLRSLDNRVVLGVHGVIVEERPRSYFRRRFNFHFAENAIDSYRLVNNLGTGTVGFHSRLFPSIDPHKWARGGMVDIYFAVECKKNMIPMVCINRHSGWLVDLDETKSTPTLFQEFNEKETLITNELKLAAPWGYAGIDQVVEAQDPGLRRLLAKALPRFHRSVSVSTCFQRYRA
jgi:glycosyltransferase involved in cell wall biosynthesis